MIGFGGSGWLRVVIGVAFTLAAVAMVVAIEHPTPNAASDRPSEPTTSSLAPPRAVRVGIESTFAVAIWTVSVAGHSFAAQYQDAWSWHGSVSATAGAEVLIEATAQASSDRASVASSLHALRMVIGDLPATAVWGSGDVVATVRIP
jgi:hypothetical protein